MFNPFDGIASPNVSLANILESVWFIIMVCLVEVFISMLPEMEMVVVVGGIVSDAQGGLLSKPQHTH